MRFIAKGNLLALILFMAGCASPPTEKAIYGNPFPLMDLVTSNQVGVNDRLPSSNIDSNQKTSVLCALVGHAAAAAVVDMLLNKGADVNMPCEEGKPSLPLDYVLFEIINRGSNDSPYRANKQYRPSDLPILFDVAQKLIARGALSKKGKLTLREFQETAKAEIASQNANVAGHYESYNKTIEQNKALLGAATAVAGVVVTAKVLEKNRAMAGAALDSATKKSSPTTTIATSSLNDRLSAQSSASQSARTSGQALSLTAVEPAKQANSSNAMSRKREPHKPYADNDPYLHKNHWTVLSGGEGSSRQEACNKAHSNGQIELSHFPDWGLRLDAVTECVCSVNVGYDQSILDAMALAGQPDYWLCTKYRQATNISTRSSGRSQ